MLDNTLMSQATGTDYSREYWIMDDYLYKAMHKIPAEYPKAEDTAVQFARLFAMADYCSETDYRRMTETYMAQAFYGLMAAKKYESAQYVLKALFDNQKTDPDLLRGVLQAMALHKENTGETISYMLLERVTDKSLEQLLKEARMGSIREKLPRVFRFFSLEELLGLIGYFGLIAAAVFFIAEDFIEGNVTGGIIRTIFYSAAIIYGMKNGGAKDE